MRARQFVAVDPHDGRHLRPATEPEAAAYLGQPLHPSHAALQLRFPGVFMRPVRVGPVLVDEYSGPGIVQCWPDGDWLE